jgi:hypothetical protein
MRLEWAQLRRRGVQTLWPHSLESSSWPPRRARSVGR